MTAIASPHNQRLKELRKLARAAHRARTGLFAAEGEDLIAAARAAGREPVEGFRVPGVDVGGGHRASPANAGGDRFSGGHRASAANAGGDRFHEVEPAALAAVSTLGSGTRAIGVYEQRWSAPTGPLCVYLHGVGDPGNVGTVLRGALAFGASSVALGPGCADPHSPKAVRASMGAIFSVALARVADVGELPGTRVALVAGSGQPIWDALRDAVRPAPGAPAERGGAQGESCEEDAFPALTLLVGAEREGLPDDVVNACERVAHIPIASESLNAAMAATIALYETTRPSTRVPPS